MNNEKEQASLHFQAGKRTYFFDVQKSKNESKYLKITESKATEGVYERHSILIFEEDMQHFYQTFNQALDIMQKETQPSLPNKMQQTKDKFKNAYQMWTEEEDLKLTEWFCSGKKVTEISQLLERNRGAITSRIKKLELREKYGE